MNLNRFVDNEELTLYQATGCDQCNDNGYIGRSVVTELLTLSEPIRRLILSRADGTSIQNTAVESGMDTMQVDGIKKALTGITTIEDVMRVTREI